LNDQLKNIPSNIVEEEADDNDKNNVNKHPEQNLNDNIPQQLPVARLNEEEPSIENKKNLPQKRLENIDDNNVEDNSSNKRVKDNDIFEDEHEQKINFRKQEN
ncbi:unnamed protein product, partial [Didymodactylos carnosus]